MNESNRTLQVSFWGTI